MRYICYSSYQHGEMKTIAHFCSRKGDGRCQWALIAPVRTLFVTMSIWRAGSNQISAGGLPNPIESDSAGACFTSLAAFY